MRRGGLAAGVVAVAVVSGACGMASQEFRGEVDLGSGPGSPGMVADSNSEQHAGVLTAGAWDDNLNFDFFLSFIAHNRSEPEAEGLLQIHRNDRVEVKVVDAAGAPVAGATVTLLHSGQERFHSVTAGEGRVILFPSVDGVTNVETATVRAQLGGLTQEQALTPGGTSVTLTLADFSAQPLKLLDAVLVIDATGSMSDEAGYLVAEFQAMTGRLQQEFPHVAQRWALVHYRDTVEDEYVVRSRDFTSDLQAFQASLAQVQAGGGGDYPEAVERGLDALTSLSWHSGARARVAFVVADAPHHSDRTSQLMEPIKRARQLGIHIYPVASSGVDIRFEDTFRSLAQSTGGRYLFLTNDSQVGGDHKEPTLPCYLVTTLQNAMTRMLRIELSGRYQEPTESEVLRRGGNPQDGACTVSGGERVLIF